MRNQRWDLSSLYKSFDDESFKSDLALYENKINEFVAWCEKNLNDTDDAIKKIEYFITNTNETSKLFSNIANFAWLTVSVESHNIKALNAIEKIEAISPNQKKCEILFTHWLDQIENIAVLAEKSSLIEDHLFILKELLEQHKYSLNKDEEVLMAKMKNTSSTAWSKLQGTLTSTLLVDIDIDGEAKQLPLSKVRNLATDEKQSVRKTAYEAELKSYEKIDESVAAALNNIKGEVITECEIRGYKSPLEMTLLNSRLDQKTLDTMLSAIEKKLPSFEKYFIKKANLLGETKGLPFYDLFAPVGDGLTYSYDEGCDFIIKNFSTFSDKLANFASHALDNQWVDAEPRHGKRGGGFCAPLEGINQSRILMNYENSFDNVATLAHELGHAYHNLCLEDETPLNSSYSMPIAETASIFCETIVTNAALKTATKGEALGILENSIMGASQVIVDIYSRYTFETELFKRRKEGSVSVADLKSMMISAQKKAYGNGLNHEYLHPYMWVCKPHYYSAGTNFYNFPYAFGLLFAKGLYAIYLKDADGFKAKYDALLASTGKNSIYDVAKQMDIDLHDETFWLNSLKVVENDIDAFEKY